MKTSWIATAVFTTAIAMVGAAAQAEPKASTYSAQLAPASGVTSSGKGSGDFSYDPATHTLTYKVTYEGLSGPAVAAHIHGPAAAGANAAVVIPFAAAATPISGTATLTDAQAADLDAGKYYVNVHTAANKGGEIRGQIVKK